MRLFCCYVCHKTFDSGSDYLAHKKKHDDLKPFACHLCDQRFLKKEYLKNHIFNHKSAYKRKCNICQKGFDKNSEMLLHCRYSCITDCDEMENLKNTMYIKEMIRTEAMKYACQNNIEPYVFMDFLHLKNVLMNVKLDTNANGTFLRITNKNDIKRNCKKLVVAHITENPTSFVVRPIDNAKLIRKK